MKRILFCIFLISFTCISSQTFSQINAKLMRYMDVSDTHIVFVYGGDIWMVPKEGGNATQITHSPGEESWPRFSPNGEWIGYSASYNGNEDVYVISSKGGVPTRITYHTDSDRMIDWHPDGNHLIFASKRETGQRRTSQIFLVNKEGSFPERLSVPYGELASYSPDGSKIAYITKITENYPFKRYRGGLTSDIFIFDLNSNTAENITNNKANDGKPAWVEDKIYFLSDQDENMRLNIWAYDTKNKNTTQITNFKDFDISHMSAGKNEIVFEAGGIMYLLNTENQEYKPVDIHVVSDLSLEMPRAEDVSKRISNMTAAPEGKRIIFEARGELFNVPKEEGYTLNLTKSSGAFDRNPSWSPDGKYIAFWSDMSGENEIYLKASKENEPAKKITNRGKGFGYKLYWSPDSKYISFIDETNTIYLLEVASTSITTVDKTSWNVGHGSRFGYSISWSPDSKWFTYTKGLENANEAVFIYNLAEKKVHQATNGFYQDFQPVFSEDGKYLFYLTNRNMSATYSDLGDGTWIYPNTTQIAAVALTNEIPSLLEPKNDELEIKEDKENEKEETSEKEKKDEDKNKKDEPKIPEVKIDFNNFEARLFLLPPKEGNISSLVPFKGKLVYIRHPNSGSGERNRSLMFYDFEERENKEIMGDVNAIEPTADGKSLLVYASGKYGIIKPQAGQKIEKAIPTDGLVMQLIPKEEWKQIFNDTWRRHRDFFYDPNMQGVNWNEMKERYGALIEDARSRWDVTNIQSNLAAELSAGHTYTFGGDVERISPVYGGFLGIDWELSDNKYNIKRIVKPAVWDTEVRSPFDKPGVDISEGDFIFAVNGIDLDPEKDPYAAFEGLSGKTVSLEVGKTANRSESKKLVVKCLTSTQESQLRYLEWIENNRKMVDKLSDGKLGYVYMSNTSSRGQLELVSMYYGQLDKKGFIIDERFNGGGQLADRFLELLKRPVVYNLHWRHGKDHTWPIKTNTGPVGMLINGWAGSGGDGLPWAFQELKAGPIVGERTLGILVGPATGHQLIDGGGITVPGARLYDNDGHWFWEGEGVSPDYEVMDDPNLLVKGRDPQMEKVVEEVLKLLNEQTAEMTPAPKPEDRTAAGQNGKK